MASYYYLISSLPSLKTDAPMPFSYEQFLEMCEKSVNANVYGKLESLKLDSSEGPLVKQWGAFYNALMTSLCKQRSLRLGRTYSSEVEKNDLIDKAVDSALNAKNPLEAEKVLLDCQFDYLDSLVAMHFFDDYVLFGYAVKLRLLERQQCFDYKKGKAEFTRLFEGIQQQIYSI